MPGVLSSYQDYAGSGDDAAVDESEKNDPAMEKRNILYKNELWHIAKRG